MAPNNSIPANFSKYFKTTAKANKLMDPQGRVCDLDRQSHLRELVYSNHPRYRNMDCSKWDEMSWSQAVLWERSRDDETMRIARKRVECKVGEEFSLYQKDFYNEAEIAVLDPRKVWLKDPKHRLAFVASASLSYSQAQREWIYLISEKPVEEVRKGG